MLGSHTTTFIEGRALYQQHDECVIIEYYFKLLPREVANYGIMELVFSGMFVNIYVFKQLFSNEHFEVLLDDKAIENHNLSEIRLITKSIVDY